MRSSRESVVRPEVLLVVVLTSCNPRMPLLPGLPTRTRVIAATDACERCFRQS